MARRTITWLAIGLILAAGPLDGSATTCSPDRAAAPLRGEYSRSQPPRGTTTPEREKRSEVWWRGEGAMTDFGIDKRRSKELEAIFQQTLPMLRAKKAAVVRREKTLSQLLANAGTSKESAVVRAVEDLEAARRSLSRTYTMMQYYMYRQLTAPQRAKVHAYLDHHAGQPGAPSTPR